MKYLALRQGVLSVNKNSLVGQATVHANAIKKNSIPGYPTYFCFFPAHRVFGTIRFDQSVNGQRSLQEYLFNFLSFANTKYMKKTTVDTDDGTHQKITQYISPTATNNVVSHPLYKTKPYRNKGNIEFIQSHFNEITHITTRHTISRPFESISNKVQTTASIFRWITGLKEETLPDMYDQQIETRFAIKFQTPKKLNMIISEWNSEQIIGDTYNDYGFKIKGKQEIYWLNSSLAKDDFNFNIEFNELSVISSESLLKEVTIHYERILGLIK